MLDSLSTDHLLLGPKSSSLGPFSSSSSSSPPISNEWLQEIHTGFGLVGVCQFCKLDVIIDNTVLGRFGERQVCSFFRYFLRQMRINARDDRLSEICHDVLLYHLAFCASEKGI